MKYMKEIGIIIVISFIGEMLNYIIPLKIPASIYGLIILFVCLKSKIITLNSVEYTGRFLIEIMPLMFIPAAAGLINVWSELKEFLVPIVIITVLTTVIMLAVTGLVTQKVIRIQKRDKITKGRKFK